MQVFLKRAQKHLAQDWTHYHFYIIN
jgi:hypothetical protein